MAEKAVYSLTETGNEEFEKLMLDIASKPIYIFLDFNAVIVNLDSLSPEHREIFMLREFTGLSYAEIALELSISEGTVKSRLARARRAIADFLIKNGTIDRIPRQNIGEEGTK